MVSTGGFVEDGFECDRAVPRGALVCAGVGRGLFVAWMMLNLMPGSSLDAGVDDPGLLMALRAFSSACLVVCLLVPLVLWRAFDRTRTRVAAIVVAHALGCAGGALYALAALGAVPWAVQFAAIACTAAAVPLAGPVWGELFTHFPRRPIVRATLGGLAVTAAALVLVRALPAPAASALLALIPLASGALLLRARRGFEPEPCRDPVLAPGALQPSPRLLGGCFAAMAAAGARTGSSEFSGVLSVDSFVASFAVAALAVLVALRFEERVDFATAGQVLAAAMALGFAGLVLLGPSLQGACAHVVATVQQCLGTVMWLALLGVAQATRCNPYFVMGAGLLAVNAGPAVGALVGMAALTELDALVAFALLLLLGALWCFATAERPVEVHVDPNQVFERKLAAFAQAHQLTPRERDVLRYWVMGRQLAYVADTLGVAKNTAKTHVLHIYQKSGAKNKEELMRLFDAGEE